MPCLKKRVDLHMAPSLKDYVQFGWQLVTGFRLRGEKRIGDERNRDIAPYLDISRPLRVLDLANGRLRPQYLLLQAEGHRVCGIDLANRPRVSFVDFGHKIARWLFARREPLAGKHVGDRMLVCGDVQRLPLRSNILDLVTSVAAFEHFLNIPPAIAELHRVLRPGGLAWVRIHLFTSLSGGHIISPMEIPLRKIPKGMDAWDQLRKRRVAIQVPLNEWRRNQYLEAFARHFGILKHYCATREGESLLTPEIESELSEYDRDELTCAALVILAQKKGSPTSPEVGKS
jgi:SAM-dependent methyltransferase